jgi:hypothetical protein
MHAKTTHILIISRKYAILGGRKMKKKLSFFIIAAVMLFGNMVLASPPPISYAKISSTMTGADGAEHKMSDDNLMTGGNDKNSTNDLYVEVYQTVTGPDKLIQSIRLKSGEGINPAKMFQKSGYLYIHLDPAGAFYTGCNGWGTVAD